MLIWLVDVNRDELHNGGNKLRTYKSFKRNFQLENFCKTVLIDLIEAGLQNSEVALLQSL